MNNAHKLQSTTILMCGNDTNDVGVALLSEEAAREVQKQLENAGGSVDVDNIGIMKQH